MDSRVVYLGHLPHGFYDPQIRAYFSQFGTVTKVRVSRNPKTGACRHYAFLEFEDAGVARIAAKAMDGYLLAGKVLKCHIVESAKVKPEMFRGKKWVMKEGKPVLKSPSSKKEKGQTFSSLLISLVMKESLSPEERQTLKQEIQRQETLTRSKLDKAFNQTGVQLKPFIRSLSVDQFREAIKKIQEANSKFLKKHTRIDENLLDQEWKTEYAEELAELKKEHTGKEEHMAKSLK